MVIQKVEIQNFRLFYRHNEFVFSNGLNLIIGANGDGKTTFYDALEWLFCTDGINKMDTKFISKKRWEELLPNDSDEVRVAMAYEHEGRQKVLVKHFLFTKSYDGEVRNSNYMFSLIDDNGREQSVKDGVYFDKDLPSEIRKFIMLNGWSDLNVLQSSNAMKILINSHSNVRDFDAYFAFMEYATRNAERARDHALKMDKKNADRAGHLKKTIDTEVALLAEVEREIHEKENEAVNFENLLKSVFEGSEASKLLVSVNHKIERLTQKRSECIARIREHYNANLLSDMWILLGFKNIAEEYSAKVNELRKERRKLESDYLVNNAVARAAKLLESGASEYFDQPDFYKHDFACDLQNQEVLLERNLAEIAKITQKIKETIALNERLHNDVAKIDANLETEYEQKKRLLAQADGLTEEQLLANYENISNWLDKKHQTESRIDMLKRAKMEHVNRLEEARLSLSKMSEGTDAARYAKVALLLQHIHNAFKNARDENKRRIINTIEDKANMFLQHLYTDDYTGLIRMVETQNGQVEAFLIDADSCRVFRPSYSLRKAYLLSLLLSIGEVLNEKNNTEMPLIINDSVSRYDENNENKFFDATNRQMIILTSDYLAQGHDGRKFVDADKLSSISGTAYRIEKKRPFDNTKLATMQTTISKIK